ncbi:unnamed protein product, partial [Sphacelaria rigidula]
KAWEATHRPRFMEAFLEFDPEGIGEMCASEMGDFMLKLQLAEFLRPEEVDTIRLALAKVKTKHRVDGKKAGEKAARRAGLQRAPDPPRPFTTGGRERRPVSMMALWRWYTHAHGPKPTGNRKATRKQSRRLKAELRRRERAGEPRRAWARRVILAVGERDARLQAADIFRDSNMPRFLCPECHEFGCSSADTLDYHLSDTKWHANHASLQEKFEENADLVAVARRVMDGDSFPDFFEVARSMPEETEIQVFQAATDISRPLGTITYDMLVLALQEEGEWLKINFESHEGVYAKHTVRPINDKKTNKIFGGWGEERPLRVLTRMRLPAARSSTKAAAATAFLSPTTASTILVQPLALAASGLRGISHTAANALHTTAMMLIYRQKYSPEPEVLAPGTAVFKPRIVRFAVPVVYCHAKGLLPGT